MPYTPFWADATCGPMSQENIYLSTLIKNVNPIIQSAKRSDSLEPAKSFSAAFASEKRQQLPGPLILAMTFGLKCGLLLLLLSTSCAQKAPESSTYRTKGVYEGFITNMSF